MRTISDRAGFSLINEIGVTFHLVKVGLSFQPLRYPGMAYEIIYVLEINGLPKPYTTYEGPEGIVKVPTTF